MEIVRIGIRREQRREPIAGPPLLGGGFEVAATVTTDVLARCPRTSCCQLSLRLAAGVDCRASIAARAVVKTSLIAASRP